MILQFPAKNDTIIANSTQIHQVMINLGTDAFHAMQTTGGVLNTKDDEASNIYVGRNRPER